MVDNLYFDRLTGRFTLEPEPIRPIWSYIEVLRGVNEGIITEHYSDGDKRLSYSYDSDTPRNLIEIHKDEVSIQRKALFEHNPGNWVICSMILPNDKFEEMLELCDK